MLTDFSNIRNAYLAMGPTVREDFPKIVQALQSAIRDCKHATADLKKPKVSDREYEAYDVSDYLNRIEEKLIDAFQNWLQAMYDRGDNRTDHVRQLVAQTAVDLHVAYSSYGKRGGSGSASHTRAHLEEVPW